LNQTMNFDCRNYWVKPKDHLRFSATEHMTAWEFWY